VTREIEFYRLEVILAVGYRVRSPRGTQFRQCATAQLEQYLVKGFAMDDERLKQAGGGNYFDELLARIRDIRSSERVFWRKVLDIYATSVDYDPRIEASQKFFAVVQNKMHWAAHGHTARAATTSESPTASPQPKAHDDARLDRQARKLPQAERPRPPDARREQSPTTPHSRKRNPSSTSSGPSRTRSLIPWIWILRTPLSTPSRSPPPRRSRESREREGSHHVPWRKSLTRRGAGTPACRDRTPAVAWRRFLSASAHAATGQSAYNAAACSMIRSIR